MSLFVALIFDSMSLPNNVLPKRVTAPWCQRIFPLSLALPPGSTSAARHHYHHGTNHRHRVAKEVRSQASCSRTAYTSAYTFAVGSDHPPLSTQYLHIQRGKAVKMHEFVMGWLLHFLKCPIFTIFFSFLIFCDFYIF